MSEPESGTKKNRIEAARRRVMALRPAPSRTSVRAPSISAARSNATTSSAIRPASILDRSRMSLISDRRCRPEAQMSSR